MPSRRYALLLLLVFLLGAVVTSSIRSQHTGAQPPTTPQQPDDARRPDPPVADFNAPEPDDPGERAKRKLWGQRHNLRDRNLSAEDAARFVLRERDDLQLPPAASKGRAPQPAPRAQRRAPNPPVIASAATDDSPPEAPLPTHLSDAVIIGSVTEARAHLSEDKTSVYSEFTVKADEVLKGGPGAAAAGDFVTALRAGGAVRFPSGAVRNFLVGGRGLPGVGGRYVLFLKYDELAQALYIVTGYELRGGRVFPLDGIPPYGSDRHPFAPYAKYINADEAAFLGDLRQALVNPPQPASGGFPIVPAGPEGGAQ